MAVAGANPREAAMDTHGHVRPVTPAPAPRAMEQPEGEAPPAPVTLTLPEFRRAVTAQLGRAAELKDAGNAAFKAGELGAAVERYADALEQLAGCLEVPALRDRGDMADLRRRAHAAHAACHMNLAAVGLKQKAYEAALEHVDEALRYEARSAKAHFRRAQALLSLGREAEAARAAAKAAALDPRCPAARALAQRAAAEAAGAARREAARFGGLFGSARYEEAAAESRRADAEAAARYRRRVADAVLRAAAADDAGAEALRAWADGGREALSSPERRAAAATLVRAAARAGALEDGEARDTLREHGLGGALLAAGDPSAEGLSSDEAAEAAERAQLARVRGICAKARDRQALSAEELGVLDAFRAAEVARLEQQPARSQEEAQLLQALKAQRDAAQAEAQRAQAAEKGAQAALERLNSGAHIGPRERFDLLARLRAEEARLAALDEEGPGVTSAEAATLRQLRAERRQREARQEQRAKQQEALKAMQAAGA